MAGLQHKLYLFMDDILFFTAPLTTTPNLFRALEQFSLISVLEVNQQKSQALNFTLPNPVLSQLQTAFRFKWATHNLPHLGVKLTPQPSSLFQARYPAMLVQLTSLMCNWSPLKVSWLGHTMAVKMTLLPNILYLFRVLSVTVPLDYLRILQPRVNANIWVKPD